MEEVSLLIMLYTIICHIMAYIIRCRFPQRLNGMVWRRGNTDTIRNLRWRCCFQSKTPFKYWVEAYFTANYLSNLLPSSVVGFKTAYELLHKRKPEYSFLRVFGAACYLCLRPYGTHKFDPQSLQCIFLGYHAQYKGYRCLYLLGSNG